MRKQTQHWRAILAGSLSVLAVPVVLPSLSSADMTACGQGSGRVSERERDLAGGEVFTQADRDLVERVRLRLQEDLSWSVAAPTLGIYADAGTVFLSGFIDTPEDKRAIGEKVQRITGVEAVKNQLHVRTPTASPRGAEDTADEAEATQTRGLINYPRWARGQRLLEQHLPAGKTRAFYRQRLAAFGHTITSVIIRRPNYYEYETVKGNQTYEVQLTFNPATDRARFVNVVPNTGPTTATQRTSAWSERLQEESNTPGAPLAATARR